MSEPLLSELDNLTDYAEIFHFTKEIVQRECDFDGISIVVYDKKKKTYILMPEDLQWRDMSTLPDSLVRNSFQTGLPEIIDEPTSQPLCNPTFDCSNEKEASALLLFPILSEDERYSAVFSFWKLYEKEKEEIIEPLIVGSQMIGSRTRVKSTMIHRTFEQENIEALRSIASLLLLASKKLAEQTEIQKETLIDAIKTNEQVFKTPQEIIAALVNVLMGTNASLTNIIKLIKQLKQQTHPNDKNMPRIAHLETLADELNGNLLHAFQFATTNNVIDELFKGKSLIETKSFFEHFATTVKELVCDQNISLLFFLDARLPSQIRIDRQNTYIFVTELLRFALQHTSTKTEIEMHISPHHRKPSGIMIRLAYSTDQEYIQLHRSLFRDKKEVFEDPLYLAYNKFVQTGGNAASVIDVKKQQVSLSLTIPYEREGNRSVSTLIPKDTLKIGLLLDQTQDMSAANNIARYLLSMGISKSQLKGTVTFELLQDDLTHLIVFQSKFSDELFKHQLPHKSYHVMTVIDGCQADTSIDFYDYSVVDMELDKNQLYLDILEEFLQMEDDQP